jgi:hypothetical protein
MAHGEKTTKASKKRLLILAALLVSIGLACLLVWPRSEAPNQIRHDTFDKIEKGMTRAAVVQLLGVAPGDYVTKQLSFVRPIGKQLMAEAFLPKRADETEEVWMGNGGKITVWFGGDGTVTRRAYMPAAFPASLWDRVRDWTGL